MAREKKIMVAPDDERPSVSITRKYELTWRDTAGRLNRKVLYYFNDAVEAAKLASKAEGTDLRLTQHDTIVTISELKLGT